jgi:hypothetical protein
MAHAKGLGVSVFVKGGELVRQLVRVKVDMVELQVEP